MVDIYDAIYTCITLGGILPKGVLQPAGTMAGEISKNKVKKRSTSSPPPVLWWTKSSDTTWENKEPLPNSTPEFKRAHGEMRDADVTSADNWTRNVLSVILEVYDPDDIYNCDETGLLYRALPKGTLGSKGEDVAGYFVGDLFGISITAVPLMLRRLECSAGWLAAQKPGGTYNMYFGKTKAVVDQLVIGDQATCKNIRGAKRLWTLFKETMPERLHRFHRLNWAKENPDGA
uniref:DDE-1 domain-containing protein n=1 Tax=Branchiostoma floridae TaxID=7739 RepID=C3ZAY4_BRAFL|eukprot:XP_002594010.1 hypothetical protein BRAFLDRAFT_68551 [Branchiostoma floridae]